MAGINRSIQIIEAAQKRFGIFGIEKTSMREIADDLEMSKASLYYYFSDKENLYKAVVEKEQAEFISRITELLLSIPEPEKLLREYVGARLTYFRTLLNLSRLRLEAYSTLRPVLRETMESFREREKSIIKKIFRKGIDSGKFSIRNIDRTATLFLNLLKGLRVTVVNEKSTLTIDEHEFNRLLENTLAFTEIFIKGISK